jgi:hypothetical protein
VKVSAYTTTKDCLTNNYPFEAAISSFSDIADELVIFDSSRKNDGTRELLSSIAAKNEKIKLCFDSKIDWGAPNHGVYDGIAKARSRSVCTGDVLVQFDVDETIHENDIKKWKETLFSFYTGNLDILHLPVVEFWGGQKIRIDIGPTKERITKNKPHITHGLPSSLTYIKNGLMYAKPGTDGCNLINVSTLEPLQQHLPNIDFNMPLRQEALYSESSLEVYELWFKKHVTNSNIPCIYHYSWFDIERKVRSYKNFWATAWNSLYGDNLENNPMFPNEKEITEEMIREYSSKLESSTGGWIFHSPWDGSSVNALTFENVGVTHPGYITPWIKK